MSTTTERTMTRAERLDALIRAHKEEVARLRKEIPDPEAAISAFVRERFDAAALLPALDPDSSEILPEEELDAWERRRSVASRSANS